MSGQWYVLRVVSGFENKVKNLIVESGKEAGYIDSIEDIDIFSEDKVLVRFGKKVNVKSSVMPGYLMIKMVSSPDLVGLIRSQKHVLGFLGGGDAPEPVSETEIDRLRLTLSKMSSHAVAFAVGETVKIIDGPFATFSGTIEEVDEKKKKLKIAVAILGRKIPVMLEYEQVEKYEKIE